MNRIEMKTVKAAIDGVLESAGYASGDAPGSLHELNVSVKSLDGLRDAVKYIDAYIRTCSACSGYVEGIFGGVGTCRDCGALIGVEPLTREYLKDHVNLNEAISDNEVNDIRYFDVLIKNGDDVSRVHGWFDIYTKRVVQFG